MTEQKINIKFQEFASIDEPNAEEGAEPADEIDGEKGTKPAEETDGEEGTEPAEENDGEEEIEPAEENDGEEETEPANGEEVQDPLTADALLPDYASVSFDVTWDGEPGLGATARFRAVLVGYDGLDCILQWQSSVDNVNWTNIEGANGEAMDVVITEDNCTLYWRVKVFIRVAQES